MHYCILNSHREAQARRGEEAEVDPEQFQDPDNEYGLFAGTTYEQDDEEADRIYESVDDKMDSRRRKQRCVPPLVYTYDLRMFFVERLLSRRSWQSTVPSGLRSSSSLLTSNVDCLQLPTRSGRIFPRLETSRDASAAGRRRTAVHMSYPIVCSSVTVQRSSTRVPWMRGSRQMVGWRRPRSAG